MLPRVLTLDSAERIDTLSSNGAAQIAPPIAVRPLLAVRDVIPRRFCPEVG
jgi:hypothetical protein